MLVQTLCPHCSKTFQVASQFVGRRATCRSCGETFVVQAAPTEEGIRLRPETASSPTSQTPTATQAMPLRTAPEAAHPHAPVGPATADVAVSEEPEYGLHAHDVAPPPSHAEIASIADPPLVPPSDSSMDDQPTSEAPPTPLQSRRSWVLITGVIGLAVVASGSLYLYFGSSSGRARPLAPPPGLESAFNPGTNGSLPPAATAPFTTAVPAPVTTAPAAARTTRPPLAAGSPPPATTQPRATVAIAPPRPVQAAINPFAYLKAPPPVGGGVPVSANPVARSVRKPPQVAAFATLSDWTEAGEIESVVFSATPSPWFVTVRKDALENHVISRWSTQTMASDKTVSVGAAPRQTYAISPNGQYLLRVSPVPSPQAEVWSFDTGALVRRTVLSSAFGEPTAMAFLDAQSFVVLWQKPRFCGIEIFDARHGVSRKQLALSPGERGAADYTYTPGSLSISPDGKTIALVDSAMQLRLIDVVSGASRRTIPLTVGAAPRGTGTNGAMSTISYSPDGKRIAVLVDLDKATGAVLFYGPVAGTAPLTAVNFPQPLWKAAGLSHAEPGRIIQWVGDGQWIMAYGELLVDLPKGMIAASVHVRQEGQTPDPGSPGGYRLSDRSLLLSPTVDTTGRKLGRYQLLTLDLETVR